MTRHFDLPVGRNYVKATIESLPGGHGNVLWLLGRGAARLDSLDDRKRQAELFKCNMLTFDYTGQGETTGDFGQTTINSHLAEARAAYRWFRDNRTEPMTITGASYGGFIAALLANEHVADNLILRAPALFPFEMLNTKWTNLEPEIDNLTKGYRRDIEAMVRNPLFLQLSKFTGRILLIEHGDDEVIPLEVLKAYRRALPQADYWVAPGIQHSVTASGRKAQDRYESYIANWLEG